MQIPTAYNNLPLLVSDTYTSPRAGFFKAESSFAHPDEWSH